MANDIFPGAGNNQRADPIAPLPMEFHLFGMERRDLESPQPDANRLLVVKAALAAKLPAQGFLILPPLRASRQSEFPIVMGHVRSIVLVEFGLPIARKHDPLRDIVRIPGHGRATARKERGFLQAAMNRRPPSPFVKGPAVKAIPISRRQPDDLLRKAGFRMSRCCKRCGEQRGAEQVLPGTMVSLLVIWTAKIHGNARRDSAQVVRVCRSIEIRNDGTPESQRRQ